MADHYLALSPTQRAAHLTTTVDKVPASAEQPALLPRTTSTAPSSGSPRRKTCATSSPAWPPSKPSLGLNPISTVLSANTGGVGLQRHHLAADLVQGGGSEPGVLTLGYLGPG